MLGKDLIKFIQDNNLQDKEVWVESNGTYTTHIYLFVDENDGEFTIDVD